MRVRFWGTRGSLPVALSHLALKQKLEKALVRAAGKNLDTPEKARAFIENELEVAISHTYGGNSSCVEIETGSDEYLLCDMGTGLREFSNNVSRARAGRPGVYHIFLSHVHWDHIMGFPFFMPAYISGNHIRIYGCHAVLEEALRRQYSAPWFPVDFSQLEARIEFIRLEPGRSHDVAGFRVTPKLQLHSGDSYGYRFEKNKKTVVYSTDSEHRLEDEVAHQAFVDFFHDADLVIFDAMYSLAESISVKQDWGHSSNIVGVELCQSAHVKHLCMFHHEPANDDENLTSILNETRRLEEITRDQDVLKISAAYDGLEITV
ncbi:MAG: MBL fold metallo-hydrolase [Burkholderiales bacterium]